MTITRMALLLMTAAASSLGWAQSPDCPKKGVTLPARPPQVTQALPPDAVFDAEEGHVSAILTAERAAKPGALPQRLADIAADVSRTPLAEWRYEGYLPEPVPHRVSRFFRSPEGALLGLGEWDYKPDVGDLKFPGMNNASVADRPAGMFSLRAPSGCVSTTLSWKDDRKLYRLEIVGPLDVEQQRAMLARLADAIARAM